MSERGLEHEAAEAWHAGLTDEALVRGRSRVGAMEVLHCSDGSFRMDGGAMFGVVPKTLWEKRTPADAQNRVLLGTNCAVVRTGRHTVLIETGIGPRQPEKMREILGHQGVLPRSLAEAGVDPAEVDFVVNTHLHFDHCGWNTTTGEDGVTRPTFPNARYVVAAGEVEAAHQQRERDRVSYQTLNYDPLLGTGQMEAWTDERIRERPEVCPGVWLELMPGHTASMVGVHVESRGAGGTVEHACFVGDLLPTSAHLPLTWGMGYDLDPLRVIEERKRLYRRAVEERWVVWFPHDHGMPAARLETDGEGRLVAVGV